MYRNRTGIVVCTGRYCRQTQFTLIGGVIILQISRSHQRHYAIVSYRTTQVACAVIDQVAVGADLRSAVDKNIVVIVGLAVQLLPGAVNDSIAPNPDLTVIRGQGAAFLYHQSSIAAHNVSSHIGIVSNIDLRHHFNVRNGCLTVIDIGNREFGRVGACLCSADTGADFRLSGYIDGGTSRCSGLIGNHHKAHIAAVYRYGHWAFGGSWDTSFPQTENIAFIIFSIILAVFQLNIGCIYCNRALDNGITCTENILHMRSVGIDRNIAAYVTAQGSVDFRQIIRVGCSSFVPCPCIFIGVDRNVAVYRIIALNAGIESKAIACADNRPVGT